MDNGLWVDGFIIVVGACGFTFVGKIFRLMRAVLFFNLLLYTCSI